MIDNKNDSDHQESPLSLTVGAWTAYQVGQYLGMSKSSIWRLHSRGALPLPVKIGARCKRWKKAEIIAWLNADAPCLEVWLKIRDEYMP